MRFLLIFFMSCILIPGSVCYASNIDIEYNGGIYHITLKGERIKKKINFVSSDGLLTNKEVHQRTKAKLTVSI